MTTDLAQHDLLTPEQAAEYLQINRETVYRYIRDGKLIASRLGRSYRIPRAGIEMFLWAGRTQGVALREYSPQDIQEFLRRDEPDPQARELMHQIRESATESVDRSKKAKHSLPA